MNVGAVLRMWLPALLMLTILGVNLSHLDIAGVPTVWAVSLVLVAAVVVLWVVDLVAHHVPVHLPGGRCRAAGPYFMARARVATWPTPVF